jgi:large subunit ribosomal protein L31
VKADIHPKWYVDAKITCASCGMVWNIPGTNQAIRVDICSNCHPFYTGEQKIVDTEGMVDKFLSRLQARDQRVAERRAKEDAKQNADLPLETLELGKRYEKILVEAGITTISQLIAKFQTPAGEEEILALPGIGVKVLADAKRRISELGYKIPTA